MTVGGRLRVRPVKRPLARGPRGPSQPARGPPPGAGLRGLLRVLSYCSAPPNGGAGFYREIACDLLSAVEKLMDSFWAPKVKILWTLFLENYLVFVLLCDMITTKILNLRRAVEDKHEVAGNLSELRTN